MKLACSECEKEVPGRTLGCCPSCHGILQPEISEDRIQQLKQLSSRHGLDRYRDLMPVSRPIPFLGEGETPLIRSRRIGPRLGLKRLYFKNEGRNPSGAFKDRAAALAVALALEQGARGLLTASSGNSASALATYCAAEGLPCLILLEPGNPPGKMRQVLATGGTALQVEGIFNEGPEVLSGRMREIAGLLEYYLAFVWAPVNPLILEGIKSISYEVVAGMGHPPGAVVCPVGGGDMLAAQWRGYQELKKAGCSPSVPRMIGVQSNSAPPLLKAFQKNASKVDTLPSAQSEVSGINVAFTGNHALQAVRSSGGSAVGVDDHDIFEMQKRLALEEGLWVEPAGAAPVAALSGLLHEGGLDADEPVVCILSGAGFKDSKLAASDSERLIRNPPVPFAVDQIVRQAGLDNPS